MNTNEPNEQWYPVPGFPKYEISSMGRLKGVGGHMLTYRNRNQYALRRDRRQYDISPQRLLYAALHDMDPLDLRGIYIVAVKGKLVPMTRVELCRYAYTQAKKPSLGKATAVEYYKENIRFSQMMIDYYETRDISTVAEELMKCERRIKAYIIKVWEPAGDGADEAWSEIITRVLSYISDGNISIIDPYSYLRRCAKSYFTDLKKYRKRAIRFNDEIGTFDMYQE